MPTTHSIGTFYMCAEHGHLTCRGKQLLGYPFGGWREGNGIVEGLKEGGYGFGSFRGSGLRSGLLPCLGVGLGKEDLASHSYTDPPQPIPCTRPTPLSSKWLRVAVPSHPRGNLPEGMPPRLLDRGRPTQNKRANTRACEPQTDQETACRDACQVY